MIKLPKEILKNKDAKPVKSKRQNSGGTIIKLKKINTKDKKGRESRYGVGGFGVSSYSK